MPRKLKAPVEAYDIWTCLECDGHPELHKPEMLDHMRNVHGIDTKTVQGSREMDLHLSFQIVGYLLATG